MKRRVTDNSIRGETSLPWSFVYDRTVLLTAIRQAQNEAVCLGREVLVSVTQPVDLCDPFCFWSAFQSLALDGSLFWAQPWERRAFVGVGVAASIETTGSMRCSQTAHAWRSLLHHAVIRFVAHRPLLSVENTTLAPAQQALDKMGGPILLGGFSFDPLQPCTPLWNGFSDGLLILPQLFLHCEGNHATLTLNLMVQASDESERRSDEMMALLQRLFVVVNNEQKQPVPNDVRTSLEVRDLLPAEEWKALVAKTARQIQQGVYEKVVLARGIEVRRPGEPFEIGATLQRLYESYPNAYIFAIGRGSCYFVGATPERLVCAQNGQLQAMALAGSMPRGATEEEDVRLGLELLRSEKNRREHAIVVSMIRTVLAHVCSKVWVAGTPHLKRLKNIQHLETTLQGSMLPNRCILEAIDGLFPTPAVGGMPRDSTLALIRAQEQLDRGWYAGAIGWSDAGGNGEFVVPLRCALINGEKATLFGGCGIVGDSDPEVEYAESCWKLQVMLRGLSGED